MLKNRILLFFFSNNLKYMLISKVKVDMISFPFFFFLLFSFSTPHQVSVSNLFCIDSFEQQCESSLWLGRREFSCCCLITVSFYHFSFQCLSCCPTHTSFSGCLINYRLSRIHIADWAVKNILSLPDLNVFSISLSSTGKRRKDI